MLMKTRSGLILTLSAASVSFALAFAPAAFAQDTKGTPVTKGDEMKKPDAMSKGDEMKKPDAMSKGDAMKK